MLRNVVYVCMVECRYGTRYTTAPLAFAGNGLKLLVQSNIR